MREGGGGGPPGREDAGVPGQGGGRTDRAGASALLLLAGGVALASRGWVVGFPADPVGPRALPLFAAALLAGAALPLLFRPGPEPRWPELHLALRLGAATGLLLAYPLLLPVTGFIVTTGLVVTLLSLLFGGPLLRSALAGFAFAGGLHLLFVHALGIPLPLGSLFLAGGG